MGLLGVGQLHLGNANYPEEEVVDVAAAVADADAAVADDCGYDCGSGSGYGVDHGFAGFVDLDHLYFFHLSYFFFLHLMNCFYSIWYYSIQLHPSISCMVAYC